jgi:ABC-type multidrug transport system permease subunit
MTKIASPFKAMSARANGSEASLTLLDDDDDAKKKKKRPIGRRAGFFGQLLLLAKRSWRQVRRDGRTNKVRLITSLNSAAVFGSIFWKLGLGQTAIQDRCGLLQVSAINAAMAALMKTISSFTSEKTIVDRERASGAYDIGPYLIGKIVAELPAGAFFPLCFGAVVFPMAGLNSGTDGVKQNLPFPSFLTSPRFLKFAATIVVESFASSAMGLAVSAFAPSTEAAVAMGPAVMVMFIVFGGYYVNAENVPVAFRWITKCSLIKHSFAGLCVNEFAGLDFEPSTNGGLRGDTKHGEEVLERLGFGDETVESCLRKQLDVLGFCYALTLYVLEKNAPRFQKIEASAEKDVASETRASSESDVRAGVQSPKGTKDESREDVLSDASDAAEATS